VLYMEDVERLQPCYTETVYSLVLYRFSLLLKIKEKKDKCPVHIYFVVVIEVERLYSVAHEK
jgi:hypothetical protein